MLSSKRRVCGYKVITNRHHPMDWISERLTVQLYVHYVPGSLYPPYFPSIKMRQVNEKVPSNTRDLPGRVCLTSNTITGKILLRLLSLATSVFSCKEGWFCLCLERWGRMLQSVNWDYLDQSTQEWICHHLFYVGCLSSMYPPTKPSPICLVVVFEWLGCRVDLSMTKLFWPAWPYYCRPSYESRVLQQLLVYICFPIQLAWFNGFGIEVPRLCRY